MVERCDAIDFDHARPCKFFGEPDVTRTIGSFTPKRDKIDQERDSRRNSEISLGVFHFFTERLRSRVRFYRVAVQRIVKTYHFCPIILVKPQYLPLCDRWLGKNSVPVGNPYFRTSISRMNILPSRNLQT